MYEWTRRRARANYQLESVQSLEESFGWQIVSASASPATLTMTYKSQVQLFFHPTAFRSSSDDSDHEQDKPNAPIGLTLAANRKSTDSSLSTTLRFFLQLLQATLQGLPQHTTKIADLLHLVSTGWDLAEAIAESERRLDLVTPTEARIVGDERLDIAASILLARVRSKVRAVFELGVVLGAADLRWSVVVRPRVAVVYGEDYHEKNMTEFLRANGGDGTDGWDVAVRKLTDKLIARGAKGARKA